MAVGSFFPEDLQSNRFRSFSTRLHISNAGYWLTRWTLCATVHYLPIILLSWACVKYGERKHGDPQLCASRLDRSEGFTGNPDFYGLGIRLGVYIQWLALLIANAFLPSERRAMAGAYAAFSIALLVATFLLVFQQKCTFTAEMIVVLNFLWGGNYIALVPWKFTKIESAKGSASLLSGQAGVDFLQLSSPALSLPVTAWFWLRLALRGQEDFLPTPGGTSFALLSHVRLDGIGPASKFMAFLCLWLSSEVLMILNIAFLVRLPRHPIIEAFVELHRLMLRFSVAAAFIYGHIILMCLFLGCYISLEFNRARIENKYEQCRKWFKNSESVEKLYHR